jgi:hypothetical protein
MSPDTGLLALDRASEGILYIRLVVSFGIYLFILKNVSFCLYTGNIPLFSNGYVLKHLQISVDHEPFFLFTPYDSSFTVAVVCFEASWKCTDSPLSDLGRMFSPLVSFLAVKHVTECNLDGTIVTVSEWSECDGWTDTFVATLSLAAQLLKCLHVRQSVAHESRWRRKCIRFLYTNLLLVCLSPGRSNGEDSNSCWCFQDTILSTQWVFFSYPHLNGCT